MEVQISIAGLATPFDSRRPASTHLTLHRHVNVAHKAVRRLFASPITLDGKRGVDGRARHAWLDVTRDAYGCVDRDGAPRKGGPSKTGILKLQLQLQLPGKSTGTGYRLGRYKRVPLHCRGSRVYFPGHFPQPHLDVSVQDSRQLFYYPAFRHWRPFFFLLQPNLPTSLQRANSKHTAYTKQRIAHSVPSFKFPRLLASKLPHRRLVGFSTVKLEAHRLLLSAPSSYHRSSRFRSEVLPLRGVTPPPSPQTLNSKGWHRVSESIY